jgi:hypothetical protein
MRDARRLQLNPINVNHDETITLLHPKPIVFFIPPPSSRVSSSQSEIAFVPLPTYLHERKAFFDSLASRVTHATRTPRHRSGSIVVNFASCVRYEGGKFRIVRASGRPIPDERTNRNAMKRRDDLNRHSFHFISHPSSGLGSSRSRVHTTTTTSTRTSLVNSRVSSRSPVPIAARHSSHRPAPSCTPSVVL